MDLNKEKLIQVDISKEMKTFSGLFNVCNRRSCTA